MSQEEMVDIVDQNDNVLFSTSRKEAAVNRLCHRVVHIIVIDRNTKEICTIVRSAKVKFCPLHHGFAGGVMQAGENWNGGAKRELLEELKLDVPVIELEKKNMTSDGSSHDVMDNIFVSFIDNQNDIIIDQDEIDHVEFMHFDNLKDLISKNKDVHPLMAREFAVFEKHYNTLIAQYC